MLHDKTGEDDPHRPACREDLKHPMEAGQIVKSTERRLSSTDKTEEGTSSCPERLRYLSADHNPLHIMRVSSEIQRMTSHTRATSITLRRGICKRERQ